LLIIDKINQRIEAKKTFYSFEYFPPQTEAGLHNLYSRIERMAMLEPVFVDITWGAGGSTSDKTLGISENLQKFFGLDVLMHLTCTNMPIVKIDEALEQARGAGIRNILALRGDPPRDSGEWQRIEGGFSYAYELVSHIRERYGDELCVGVAGYPEGHLEAKDKDACTDYLKHKVDCGADFVITQLFFDLTEYEDFLERCAARGIDCPIIPGLFPIQTFDRFRKFVQFTGVNVPQEIWDHLEPIHQDDAEVRRYGVELCVQMCERLLEVGVPGFHFYTLNLQSPVMRILEGLDLVNGQGADRQLPWRPSTYPTRRAEDVRPIFWSNRPKSYLARTMDWDEFPNGRWGDRRSPSFGTLNDYYLLRRGIGLQEQDQKLREAYGEPESPAEVFEVFARFCAGDIDVFPWVDGEIQAETRRIFDELVALNRAGYLTINSQPQVTGASSEDPEVGWGGPGGTVYQKAYLELFLSDDKLEAFLAKVGDFPTLTYQAVNAAGEARTNLRPGAVTAVTWGAFPGKEIIQPTVVDFETFLIWKDEAFEIWRQEWGSLYPEGSASRQVLEEIHATYWLLNLVENDYTGGDIFAIFRELGALPDS
jgi:methylenetetrahydrofolate reductase (NADPH)